MTNLIHAAPGWLPRAYAVRSRIRETADTVTMALAPTDGGGLPDFLPGQFNMLYAHGIGEVPVSISGLTHDQSAFVHTIRAVGRASGALCRLKKGGEIGLRGPYGTSWPVEKFYGQSVLVIAGGIGLAPLMPALRQIVKARPRFLDASLYCGFRSPQDILFKNEISRWRESGTIGCSLAVDHSTEAWSGRVGVVTSLLPQVLPAPGKTAALICGPEIMMRFALADLKGLGVLPENIYLSMERNMKCALGTCGHCQFNRYFVCKDGAVFALPKVERLMTVREV